MILSESTSTLLSELQKFSGNKLKNREELCLLLQAAIQSNNERLLKDLAFTAKYLNGLGKILKEKTLGKSSKGVTESNTLDQSAEEKIRSEFKEHIQKFTFQLNTLIKDLDGSDRKSIETKFLNLTRSSMMNLTTLIYDLTWLKKYWNSVKK